MSNQNQTERRNSKIKAEQIEQTLLWQSNRLAQMLGDKIQSLKENRSGFYDSDQLGQVGAELVEDFERKLSELADMAAKIDEVSHDLQKHEMTLENIFEL